MEISIIQKSPGLAKATMIKQQERINDLALKVMILHDALKLIAETNGTGWELKQCIARTAIEKVTYYGRLLGHGGGV